MPCPPRSGTGCWCRATGCRRSGPWRPQLVLSPTTVSAAWSAARPVGRVRTDGRRGTTVLDQASPAGGRYRQAVEHPSAFALDLSTGVPDPHPAARPRRRARRSSPGARHRALPRRARCSPPSADVLAGSWPYPAGTWPSSTGRWTARPRRADGLRFGDRVVVEDPAFPPLWTCWSRRGTLVGVPLDDEGVGLDGSPRRSRPAAVFLQPRAQNPTGVSTTRRMAKALADLPGSEVLIVEDDSADGLSDAPLVTLGRGCPSARCTSLVLQVARARPAPRRDDGAGSAAPRRAGPATSWGRAGRAGCSSRCCSPSSPRPRRWSEVAAAGRTYAARRAAFVAALAGRGVEVAGTEGLNVWVPVQDETAAVVRLASQGSASPRAHRSGCTPHPATATSGSASASCARTSSGRGGGRDRGPGGGVDHASPLN